MKFLKGAIKVAKKVTKTKKRFKPWDRGNISYRLVYGSNPIISYNKEDGEDFDFIIEQHFSALFGKSPFLKSLDVPGVIKTLPRPISPSPLVKDFTSLDAVIKWFDTEYPK
ncbi:MAG: hypothetical protein ACRCU2_17920 [Planktothrix sp.]